METAEVIFDLKRTKAIYARYFNFERSRELKKVHPRILFVVSGLLIFLGLFLEVDILWIIGSIAAILTGIFLLFFVLRFEIAYNKYIKELERHKESPNRNFQFSFDMEFLRYVSKNSNTEIKWGMIKNYMENGTDLYLFGENRVLLDIISAGIIGKERFEKFRELLNEKVNAN
ncbi:MAG: hypothetical protein COA32_03620 [Fluviicola sp.]|nr:MAG: hypothetical protein COA32_03620 [Fluviicola sp.]